MTADAPQDPSPRSAGASARPGCCCLYRRNWPAILKAAQEAGVKWYFIEDEAPTSIEQIPQSMRFLEPVKF
jgi:hypothetical protein